MYVYIYIYTRVCVIGIGLSDPSSKKELSFAQTPSRGGGTCPYLVKGLASSLELCRGEAWQQDASVI